jgi:predicted ATPase/DNA-binding CsgD family transcriptional regulator
LRPRRNIGIRCLLSRAVDVTARQSDLPAEPSLLVGRDEELAAACSLLRGIAVRMVTLTGPGGVGKTRLALQVAAQLEREFRDGVFLVRLAAVADRESIIAEVAKAVSLRESGKRPLLEQLTTYLWSRRTLLVLDNFEHLVEVAPLVADLLAECPLLKILVTSRASLRIAGECEFPVPPLALPEERVPLGELVSFPAVQLLVQRASAVSGFELTDANAAAIAVICRRLDGLPLAIELAAARMRLLGPEEILARLEHPLELLTGGRRDVPERQRTLRSTIEWSYALLTEAQQSSFRGLAVFAGGCTVDAVCQVLGYDQEGPALDDLESLVDKSLWLVPQRKTASLRVEMLETIQAFARDELRASGEEAALREAHASYYLRLVEELEPALAAKDQGWALDLADADHDNVLEALRWYLETGNGENAGRLAGAFWSVWLVRGRLSQGRRWLEEVEYALAGASLLVRAKVLNAAGVLALHQADYEAATALSSRGLTCWREGRNDIGVVSALTTLAIVARDQGDFDAARALAEQAAGVASASGDEGAIALAVATIARVAFFEGDYERARTFHEQALAAFRVLGSPQEIAREIAFTGWACFAEGQRDEAGELFQEALDAARSLNDRWLTALALAGLIRLEPEGGDRQAVRERALEALSICAELDEKFLAAMCLVGIALLLEPGPQLALLLGATEGLLDGVGARFPKLHQREHTRAWSAVTVAMLPSALAERHAQGRRLTLEETVDASRSALADVVAGSRSRLTVREADVLRLVASGLTNGEVAGALVVSERTVHAHMRSIFRKLEVTTRSGATRYAVEHGLT